MLDMEYQKGETPLDPDEAEGLLLDHITTRGQLNEVENTNINIAMLWVERAKQRQRDMLTEGYIRQLHQKMLGDVWRWAGTFRTTEKNIGIDPLQIAVQLRNLLDDARAWEEYNSYPAHEAAIRFHHRLVKIHPFPNGNGRHSRIMADLWLKRSWGVAPIDWEAGQELSGKSPRKEAYVAALGAADTGDYQPLFAFAGIR